MTTVSLDTLRQLQLHDMATAYEALLNLPIDENPEAHELLPRLVDAERKKREQKRMTMFLKLRKLRYPASIQDVDCFR